MLYAVFFRIEAQGMENVPQEGPVVLCINHVSAFDPPAVGALLDRHVAFMAKVELFRHLGWLLPRLGTFPVDRDARDTTAVRSVLRLTRQGRVVAIFPEGHRFPDGTLGPPRAGAGLLAQRSGAAVVPVAVRGPWRLFGPVRIRFGPPVDLSQSQDPAADVMRAIADLYYRPDEIGQGRPWARSN